MEKILTITQMIIAVSMSLLILVQNKDGGLSAMMGGGESFQATKRGAERVISVMTVVLAILFLTNALMFVLV